MKAEMIKYIRHLVSHNVTRFEAYKNRIMGFRAEIEYSVLLKDRGFNILDGGWMLSTKKGARCLDSSIYFTISSDDPAAYTNLYSTLARLNFIGMYFIKYNRENEMDKWESEMLSTGYEIPHPGFTCYKFDNGEFVDVSGGILNISALLNSYSENLNSRSTDSHVHHKKADEIAINTLSSFSDRYLMDILANRFIFDGVLGYNDYIRGVPSDIDLIAERNGNYIFFEIKEKDRSKGSNGTPVGFGMDDLRRDDIMKISDITGCPYLYVVREVKNQNKREFLNWWKIEIHDFYRVSKDTGSIVGGQGMSPKTKTGNITHVAPIEYYDKIID